MDILEKAAVIPMIVEKLTHEEDLPQDLEKGPGNLLVDSSADCDSVALLQKFSLDSTSQGSHRSQVQGPNQM
ncbi:hypothetical protein Cadr_000020163 [Camelus dromedarius]|uniref:Uncharacterized protein n=1 Tax=Camelus dromedarius TaxID=9838 RepID=A0A5N4CZ77_CAMDR|nr:hypothetical protein Cadr_000020163 [Camelus dromedarius]